MSSCSPGTSDKSPQRVQRDYAPIRRIAQACINCRRKKVRCPGERPECSSCKRLFQDCSYEQALEVNGPSKQAQNTTEQMASRLDQLEMYLMKIDDKLERLLVVHRDPWSRSLDSCDVPLPMAGFEPSHNLPDPLSSLFSLPIPTDKTESLPPYEEQLMLVDLYFLYFHNQPYSLFHESDFRIRFHTGTLPDYLLFAVMANSFRFANNSFAAQERLQTAAAFVDSAWHSISKDCFSGMESVNLSIIQTLTLLCIFDFTAGHTRHNFAWVKIGIAVRLAQDLRLTEEPDRALSVGEREEHRRVFWSLYLLERLVSCGRCRPPAILDSTCSLRLPSDEGAWYNHLDQQTPSLNTIRIYPVGQELSTFGAVIASASVLSQCAQYMLHPQHVGRDNVPWHPQSQHAALVSSVMFLDAYLKTAQPIEEALRARCYESGVLDQSVSSSLVFSRLLFHLCQCLVYHPFLLREHMFAAQIPPPRAFWSQVKEMSHNASNDMIDLVRRSKRAGSMLTSSFSGYCMTVAATIQVLHCSAGIAEEHFLPTWYQECNDHLELLSRYWTNSVNLMSAFQQLNKNAHKYSSVLDGDIGGSRLEDQDRELMWSLLDYNTVSKQIQIRPRSSSSVG